MGQVQSDYSDQLKIDESEEDLYVPPEILIKIFSYLDICNRGRVAQVCRAWRDIAYVPCLWRHDEVSRLSPVSLFRSYLRRGIRRLKSPAEPFDRAKWARQARAFTSYCRRNGTEQLVEISLDLLGERINTATDESLVKLLKTTSKSVRSLTVSYTKWISFSSMFLVITHECSNLVKLCIVNCLQRPTINGHDFWDALRNISQLRCLVLKDFYGFDDEFFESLVKRRQDNTYPTHKPLPLTELSLSVFQGVTDKSMTYIGKSMPKLIGLNLLYCDRITFNGLTQLSVCNNLRRLTLWCPHTISNRPTRDATDGGLNDDCHRDLRERLLMMSYSLRQLETLVVVGCNYASFEIMAQFSNVRQSSEQFSLRPDLRYTAVLSVENVLSLDDCYVSKCGANQLITGRREFFNATEIRWCFLVNDQNPVYIKRCLGHIERIISSQNYWRWVLHKNL